jgi:hypothetical protein
MSSQKLFLDIFNYSNGCTYDTLSLLITNFFKPIKIRMILRKSSLSWSCQAKTQDWVYSTCEHDIFQPYYVCLCNRNITAFKVISIVLSCLTHSSIY